MRRILTFIKLLIVFTASGQDTTKSKASFYHDKFENRKTASGQIFRQSRLSAASNIYPLGTTLIVYNPTTGKSVTVIVNDRLSNIFHKRIDLSKKAYSQIADLKTGTQNVYLIKENNKL